MSAPIMSRFDLFFILVDDCNEVKLIFNKLFFFLSWNFKNFTSLYLALEYTTDQTNEGNKRKKRILWFITTCSKLHSYTELVGTLLENKIYDGPSPLSSFRCCWWPLCPYHLADQPWGGQKLFQQMCLEVYHMKKTCMAIIYWTTFILTIFLFTGNRLCHCS